MTLELARTGPRDRSNGRLTLGGMYLHAEQIGSSRVVTQEWDGASWSKTPGWRFFRQVLRVALYLRERGVLGPGDCAITLSRLRTERLIAEWAAVTRGAVVAPLGPRPSDKALASALKDLVPRVVFTGSGEDRQRVLDVAGSHHSFEVIDLDDSGVVAPRTSSWSGVCDLGGTFDTAERAETFRAEVRGMLQQSQALAYPRSVAGEDVAWERQTHGEVVKQIIAFWHRSAAQPRDLAYVVDDPLATGIRLTVWALLADGGTTIAIGTPGREIAELSSLRPNVAVVPKAVAQATMKDAPARKGSPVPWPPAWLQHLPVLRRLTGQGWRDRTKGDDRPREVLALDGTRIR